MIEVERIMFCMTEDLFHSEWTQLPLRYRMAEIGFFATQFVDIMYRGFTHSEKVFDPEVCVPGAFVGYGIGVVTSLVKEFYRIEKEQSMRQAAKERGDG